MSTKKITSTFLKEFGPFSFGELFKAHRESEGLTQAETARFLELSRQNVCDLEKGRWLPSPEIVERFAKQLGYSPTVFLKSYFEEVLKRKNMTNYSVDIKIVS